MNHSDVQSRMADYLDGDLGLDERALVDAHLDACANCSRDLSQLQRTVSLLRALPAPETPSDLADNVIARIRAGEGDSPLARIVDTLRAWLAPQVVVPATAVAAAGAVFLVSGGQLDNTPVQQPRVEVAKVDPQSTRPTVAQRIPATRVAVAPTIDPRAGTAQRVEPRPPHIEAAAAPPPMLARSQPPIFAAHSTFQPFAQAMPQTRRVVGSETGSVQALQGASLAPQRSTPSVGRERLLEERLEWLRQDPAQFAAWFRSRSRAEQDLWLLQFGRYANEQGVGDTILEALLMSGDERLQTAALELGKVMLDERAEGEQILEAEAVLDTGVAVDEIDLLD